MTGLLSYATYLPAGRLDRAALGAALGTSAGKGKRVVAGFDEDATTMAVEAGRRALDVAGVLPADVLLATTSPPYLDKTNAVAVATALGLPAGTFAADLAGSARSGFGALRSACAAGGLALVSDVRTGRPGSADERTGGDAAAAFLFGDGDPVAEVVGRASESLEVLDRWRSPARTDAEVWEERFGLEAYQPVVRRAVAAALADAGIERVDHAVVVSPNSGVGKRAAKLVPQAGEVVGSPVGHAGTADVGVALAEVLDRCDPGATVLVASVADGCDVLVLQTTALLSERRQVVSVADQLAAGHDVPYAAYLTWRGHLVREAPRRPEPERPAGPPSARATAWKFGFTGSACQKCGMVHLPPTRVCKGCGAVDAMAEHSLTGRSGRIATFTVDRLAYSPSPPLMSAVVDFDGGGRYALEVADATPDDLAVGVPVALTFRRLFTAGGVHNYFWKARVLHQAEIDQREEKALERSEA